jgi:hypothetical protein
LGELNLATALRCLFSNVGGFAAVAPPKTMAEDIDVVVATELVVAVDVFFCYCAITVDVTHLLGCCASSELPK